MNNKKIDRKINKLVEEKIEKKLEEEIDKNIDQVLAQELKPEIEKEVKKDLNLKAIPQKNTFFLTFSSCWRNVCKTITWIMLVLYIIIAALLLLCTFTQSGICVSGTVGALPYISILVVAALAASFFLATRFSDSRISIAFSFFLALPATILIIIFIVRYIGLIIIGAVLFIYIIQLTKQ